VRGAIVVQPFSQKSLVSEYSGPVLLAAGIFFLDLSVPAEVAAWLLYAIPVALTIGSSRARAPLYVMGLVACLAVTDLVVSSSGFPPVSFWLNRLLGIGVMGTVAALVATRRTSATPMDVIDREVAPVERPQEGLASETGQGRAHAELLRDKLRFEGIVQSAMDAIITA
jgi:hypothetical protein